MSIDLIQLVTSRLDGRSLESLARAIGIAPEKARSALPITAGTLLGGLIQKTANPQGAQGLASLLQSFDTGFLDAVTGRIEEGTSGSLAREGGPILDKVFGTRVDAAAQSLGATTGLPSAASGSLLQMLAPVVIGVLARESRTRGLDASGIASLLWSQRDRLASLLPADLRRSIGLGDLGARARDAASATAGTGRSWLPGLAAALIVAALLWFGYRALTGPDEPRARPDVAARAPGLADTLDSCADALSRVSDADSARAALPAVEAASRTLDGLIGSPSVSASDRASLVRSAEEFAPALEQLSDQVWSVPGAAEVLGPAMATLQQKLANFIRS